MASYDMTSYENLNDHLREVLGNAPIQIPAAPAEARNRPPLQRRRPTTGRPVSVPGVARLPNGWAHIDNVDLSEELGLRVRTFKKIPHCIRSSFTRILKW